jgi:hypothetical protein
MGRAGGPDLRRAGGPDLRRGPAPAEGMTA